MRAEFGSRPTRTAFTLWSTIWFAQPVALSGVPSVLQVSSSIGWPAMPPNSAFAYFTTASTASRNLGKLIDCPPSGFTSPTLTGVPVAIGAVLATGLPDDVDAVVRGFSLEPHALTARPAIAM